MKYKGFTLIEILIVLIVIGILATLLMPQITGMAERARTVEAKNTMSAIRTAIMAFYFESGNQMPAPAANSDAVDATIGMIVGPDAKRLFEYAYTTAPVADPPTATIFAERNTNKGGATPHSQLKMLIRGDGSADTIGVRYNNTAAIAVDAPPDTTW